MTPDEEWILNFIEERLAEYFYGDNIDQDPVVCLIRIRDAMMEFRGYNKWDYTPYGKD